MVDLPGSVTSFFNDVNVSIGYGRQYGVVIGIDRQIGLLQAAEGIYGTDVWTGQQADPFEKWGEASTRFGATVGTAAGLADWAATLWPEALVSRGGVSETVMRGMIEEVGQEAEVAAPKAGASSPIPGSYVDNVRVVDMTNAPGKAVNAAGFPRNGPWFWRQMLNDYPEMFSDANKAAIRAGRSPVVDDVWIESNPTHQSFAGDKLIHHHIDQGANASGLPETIHQEWHDTLHPEK
jgi:hypothetical protein